MGDAEFAPPEAPHRPFHPTKQVNPIGDMANGHVVQLLAGIQPVPHFAADMAVQVAHGVRCARGFERQHRHTEWLFAV